MAAFQTESATRDLTTRRVSSYFQQLRAHLHPSLMVLVRKLRFLFSLSGRVHKTSRYCIQKLTAL